MYGGGSSLPFSPLPPSPICSARSINSSKSPSALRCLFQTCRRSASSWAFRTDSSGVGHCCALNQATTADKRARRSHNSPSSTRASCLNQSCSSSWFSSRLIIAMSVAPHTCAACLERMGWYFVSEPVCHVQTRSSSTVTCVSEVPEKVKGLDVTIVLYLLSTSSPVCRTFPDSASTSSRV